MSRQLPQSLGSPDFQPPRASDRDRFVSLITGPDSTSAAHDDDGGSLQPDWCPSIGAGDLESLDDDLLDVDLSAIDDELKALGVDPGALAKRASEFVAKAKDEERLAWQDRARERRAQLEARASKAATRVPANMDRAATLARLDELRVRDAAVGSAITMAARKRKPEESTDEELKALLEEMEALRAIQDGEPE